jgi:hypothetical protein
VYITTIASSSEGKAIIMSASRMTTKSVRPPTLPFNIPMPVPITREMKLGTRPTTSEIRAP